MFLRLADKKESANCSIICLQNLRWDRLQTNSSKIKKKSLDQISRLFVVIVHSLLVKFKRVDIFVLIMQSSLYTLLLYSKRVSYFFFYISSLFGNSQWYIAYYSCSYIIALQNSFLGECWLVAQYMLSSITFVTRLFAN